MAYIGRSVDIGMFEKQVLTPDSSTTTFTLTFAVGSANSLLVVYGGVIQEPQVAYSVSGGGQSIVFSEAPLANHSLYIIYLGKQLTTPRAAGQETTKQTFTGDGTTTLFTLTDPPVVPAGIMVFVDGILQREGAGNNFVSSGSTINFNGAPDNGAEIDVYTLVKEKVSIDTVADGSITRAKLAASHPDWNAAGDFTFATSAKIKGDFGNSTVANRTAFQSSTANSPTRLTVLPSGTGTISAINLHGASDPTNASVAQFNMVDGISAQVQSNRFGTGTYYPLTFHTSNNEQMRITAAGDIKFGTASSTASASVQAEFKRTNASYTLQLTNDETANGPGNYMKLVQGYNSYIQASNGLYLDPTGALGVTKGISFPASQVASADPNTLDDYEEGSWTPVMAGVTSGVTTSGSRGTYTKVGNRVTLNFTFINPPAATLVGSWIITGIPFPTYGPSGDEYHGGYITYSRSVPTTTNGTWLTCQISGNVSQFGLRWCLNTTGETVPVTGNVPSNSMLLSGTIVYQTNT